MTPYDQETKQMPSARKSLYTAEFLQNHGEFARAYRVILDALERDPSNEELGKKRKELLEIICWRC